MECWKSYWIATVLCAAFAAAGCSNDDENKSVDTNAVTADGAVPDAAPRDAAAPTIVDAALTRDAGADASTPPITTTDGGKISKPGQYEGYGARAYQGYELSSLYVPVRDGTKLAVDLYRPKEADGKVTTQPLPVIWMHTPYNRRFFQATPMAKPGLSGETYPGAAARLLEYGYVVAVVDFRGLYASYGKNQGYNRGEWVDAAALDAYDITEWLATQPWSTGKIGMWGCSATGGSQLQAAATVPPHLKAIFPMSCDFDSYSIFVPGGMTAAKGTPSAAPPSTVAAAMRNTIAEPVDGDADRAQLNAAIASQAGSVDNAGYVPFRDSVADAIPGVQWWLKSTPHLNLDKINESKVAIYVASNWDEGYTKYGSFFTFNNVTNPAKLIVGPAAHCAWFTVQTMTGLDIAIEERRFFDYWLKGIDNGVMSEPKVYYYTYNAPAGKEWSSSEVWPLANEVRTPYYLTANSGLGSTKPSEADAKDQVTTDYTVTSMTLADKAVRFVSAPLATDVQVTGHPVLDLWVSSSATDGDFVATLQDVAPDGTAVAYNVHGRLRASLRKTAPAPYKNFALPYHPSNAADVTPLVAGEPVLLSFDLLPTSQVFKAGHQIRLLLSFAEATTPKLTPPPQLTIYRDAAHPSALTLPVIPR